MLQTTNGIFGIRKDNSVVGTGKLTIPKRNRK